MQGLSIFLSRLLRPGLFQISDKEDAEVSHGPDKPPVFLEKLADRVVPDGSINYKLTARVTGMRTACFCNRRQIVRLRYVLVVVFCSLLYNI